MNVFIQKIKGRERVRIKHGNQIFTIDDYNGYHGDEIEWLKNCVERFFSAYDESVKQSTEQQEAIAGEKTARDFICLDCHTQWDIVERTISYDIYGTENMMERYASQQTADKDREIKELKAEVERLKCIGHTPESEMHELSTRELIERLIASQLKVEKLEFMIEHGLGYDDMVNDITMPHEI